MSEREPFDDPSLNWTCGYSPDGPLECLDAATWHGFRLTDDLSNIAAMMASCDAHLPQMRAEADYTHPMQSACGLVGSHFKWPENYCYLEWGDDSVLSGLVVVAATGGGDG